jgi:hypothetical protein
MAYTDQQKFQNYQRLLNAISTIENEEVTEDWVEEHKDVITLYRDWVFDYSTVNPDIKDPQFRNMATSVEKLLTHLLRQVYEEHSFDPAVYLILCRAFLFLAEYTMGKDELSDFMARMTI